MSERGDSGWVALRISLRPPSCEEVFIYDRKFEDGTYTPVQGSADKIIEIVDVALGALQNVRRYTTDLDSF